MTSRISRRNCDCCFQCADVQLAPANHSSSRRSAGCTDLSTITALNNTHRGTCLARRRKTSNGFLKPWRSLTFRNKVCASIVQSVTVYCQQQYWPRQMRTASAGIVQSFTVYCQQGTNSTVLDRREQPASVLSCIFGLPFATNHTGLLTDWHLSAFQFIRRLKWKLCTADVQTDRRQCKVLVPTRMHKTKLHYRTAYTWILVG
jgi:hypothetical protein